MNVLRARLVASVAAAAIVCAAAPLARAQDPFQPGPRWTYASASSTAWLPQSVDFAAGGEIVWAVASGTSPRALVLSGAPIGAVAPQFSDASLGPLHGGAIAVGSASAGALFVALQRPEPDGAHRRTTIERRDAYAAALGQPFQASFVHDLGLLVNGPAKLAVDRTGSLAVAAVFDATAGASRIDWIDGASGTLLARRDLPSQALRAISLSSDGARLALVAGLDLFVLASDGSTVHHETLSATTNAIAISGDGKTLLVGGQAKLRVLRDVAGAFATQTTIVAAPWELPTRCAASDDGQTIAVGWWNAIQGTSVRFELWNLATQQRVIELAQHGPAGGLQNYPEAVAITPDGRRAAFGSWGGGVGQMEATLVDRDGASVVLAADLPGSVMSLALDATGTRVAVGAKHAHANQFATTGEYRLLDTGERDLQLTAHPTVGGTWQAESLEPGAKSAFYLLGARSARPEQPFAGAGTLWVDRGALSNVWLRPCDAQGRSQLVQPIPSQASLIGSDLALQVAARVGGAWRFSDVFISPVIF